MGPSGRESGHARGTRAGCASPKDALAVWLENELTERGLTAQLCPAARRATKTWRPPRRDRRRRPSGRPGSIEGLARRLHQALLCLLEERGLSLVSSYQFNLGGNQDF